MSISEHSITSVRVALGARSYPILIGSGVLGTAGQELRRRRLPRQVVLVTDTKIWRLYGRRVFRALQKERFTVLPIVIPPGEQAKSIERAKSIFTTMIRRHIERNSAVVALGGGVVGDLAGFVAATYQRGVQFVQLPTTLLAQVDSSVGGKVAVNHPMAKNMIGAFHQPSLVIADVRLLRSLPDREIVCGLGEALKYGIILRRKFFDYFERHLDDALAKNASVLRRIVAESCRMKAFVVSRDEREGGLRAILNFGHTVGHALEQAGGYRLLKHGEAVLAGMAAETYCAQRLGLLRGEEAGRILTLIRRFRLPRVRTLLREEALVRAMRADKKVAGGKIRLVLPRALGKTTLPRAVPETLLREAIRNLPELLGQ